MEWCRSYRTGIVLCWFNCTRFLSLPLPYFSVLVWWLTLWLCVHKTSPNQLKYFWDCAFFFCHTIHSLNGSKMSLFSMRCFGKSYKSLFGAIKSSNNGKKNWNWCFFKWIEKIYFKRKLSFQGNFLRAKKRDSKIDSEVNTQTDAKVNTEEEPQPRRCWRGRKKY